MGNMSHCRFDNTSRDMQDCYNNMFDNDLSDSEIVARKQFITLCVNIAVDHGHEINRPVQEN